MHTRQTDAARGNSLSQGVSSCSRALATSETLTCYMDPGVLATLTIIGINKKVYKPSNSEYRGSKDHVLQHFKMYRGKGA